MLPLQSSITDLGGSRVGLPSAEARSGGPPSAARLADFLADFYDTISPAYDTWAGGINRRVADRLAELSGPARGDQCLDVGTGTGLVARQLASAVGPEGMVVGIDVSEGMLIQARSRGVPANMRLYGVAAERLIFRDRSFDLVTCGQALNSMLDARVSLAEMARVLKPGGWIGISLRTRELGTPAQDLFYQSLEPLAQRYAILLPRFPDDDVRLQDRSVLQGALEVHGFTNVRLTQMVTGGRTSTADALLELLSEVGPRPHTLISSLGPIPRRGLEAELLRKMQIAGDDSFSYHFSYLFATARKRWSHP
jgi:ubiquinone/menaquinone biosynthesis C-methylase UbiE